ncbi:MAG: hypothetical protein PVG91_00160 [Gammaproteobacteria bacterium]|jgi:putative lipoprotein
MPEACDAVCDRRRWLPAALFLVFLGSACDRDGTGGDLAPGRPPGSAADVWEQAAREGVDFRATGNEPGWLLEIREGDSLVLMADYGTRRYEIVSPQPEIDEASGGRLFRQPDSPDAFEVVLFDEPCRDDMSGESFPTTVRLTLGERHLNGCGRSLQSPE